MADTRLFSRLKRLFSTDVIIRNVGGKEIEVMDTNQIQTSGEFSTNSLMDRYGRLYTGNPSSSSSLTSSPGRRAWELNWLITIPSTSRSGLWSSCSSVMLSINEYKLWRAKLSQSKGTSTESAAISADLE